jgi:hypothetical protein
MSVIFTSAKRGQEAQVPAWLKLCPHHQSHPPPRTQTERSRELTWGRSVCTLEDTLPVPRTGCVSLGVIGDGGDGAGGLGI